jgi:penicillin-binding protein 2
MNMRRAIVESSNVYFYTLANEMGVDLIHDQLEPFGFGRKTGIDLDGEVTGLLPSTAWKKRNYRKAEQQKWYAGETISLGIGQGYNNFTMLQIASATATLVSGGQRFAPRLVKEIRDVVTRSVTPVAGAAIEPLPLKPENVAVITNAMYGVTQEGTSTKVFAGAPYKTGGKTGTAQAVGLRANEKYNASRISEYQRDHSLYTAFGPIESPTVALAVIVENAGFGSAAAAPIARRVFDYLLAGKWPSSEDIAATQEGRTMAPIGTPRLISEVSFEELGLPPLVPAMAASGASSGAASAAAPASAASVAPPKAASAPLPASRRAVPASVPLPRASGASR